MTQQSQNLRSRRDALLLAFNKGLTALMTMVFVVALMLGLARLEIARYAFWVWLIIALIVLVAKALTAVAVRRGLVSKAAEESAEPSDLVAEAWEEAPRQPAAIVALVEDDRKCEWRKAHVSGGRTIVYRIGK